MEATNQGSMWSLTSANEPNIINCGDIPWGANSETGRVAGF